jgi:hypothetical protein
MDVPDELSLLELLEVSPTEASPLDGFWRYELRDETGVVVELSFNTLERSVQTTIRVGAQVVATVSQEGGVSLRPIRLSGEAALRGEFEARGSRTILELKLKPRLEVRWASLVEE